MDTLAILARCKTYSDRTPSVHKIGNFETNLILIVFRLWKVCNNNYISMMNLFNILLIIIY